MEALFQEEEDLAFGTGAGRFPQGTTHPQYWGRIQYGYMSEPLEGAERSVVNAPNYLHAPGRPDGDQPTRPAVGGALRTPWSRSADPNELLDYFYKAFHCDTTSSVQSPYVVRGVPGMSQVRRTPS